MVERLIAKYQEEYNQGLNQLEQIEKGIQELNKQGQDLVTRLNVITGKIEGLKELTLKTSDESEEILNGEQN